jgi:hypothetical protein
MGLFPLGYNAIVGATIFCQLNGISQTAIWLANYNDGAAIGAEHFRTNC